MIQKRKESWNKKKTERNKMFSQSFAFFYRTIRWIYFPSCFSVLLNFSHLLISCSQFTFVFSIESCEISDYTTPETGNLSNYVTTLPECPNCSDRSVSISSSHVKWGRRFTLCAKLNIAKGMDRQREREKNVSVLDFLFSIFLLPCATFTFYLISNSP